MVLTAFVLVGMYVAYDVRNEDGGGLPAGFAIVPPAILALLICLALLRS